MFSWKDKNRKKNGVSALPLRCFCLSAANKSATTVVKRKKKALHCVRLLCQGGHENENQTTCQAAHLLLEVDMMAT